MEELVRVFSKMTRHVLQLRLYKKKVSGQFQGYQFDALSDIIKLVLSLALKQVYSTHFMLFSHFKTMITNSELLTGFKFNPKAEASTNGSSR